MLPRSDHGAGGTSAPTSPGRESPEGAGAWTYLTTDLTLAWVYAWHAPGRGKPKVLTVQPHGSIEPDPEHSPHMKAWRCEWAKVESVSVDPVLSEEEARAGWVGETQPADRARP